MTIRTKSVLLLGLILLLPGCQKSYRNEYLHLAEEAGYTKAQQYASLHWSYRLLFGKEKDDKTYGILYTRLPTANLVETITKDVDNIGQVLGFEDPDTVKWVDAFGLRDHFKKQERIYQTRLARARAAQVYSEFQELMGLKPSWGNRDEFGYDHASGYDPKVFLLPDLVTSFNLESAVINDAKTKGVLKEVERYSVSHERALDHKERHPDFPDDPNQFVWKPRAYTFLVVKYKIMVDGEKPQNNAGDYAEAYRVKDAKQESKPCLRAFFKDSYAIALVDDDVEGRDIGYGLPDFVKRMSDSDLTSPATIAELFPEDPNVHRVRPKEMPIRVEIVRVGQEVNLWENAPDAKGWTVPISYKLSEAQDDYEILLKRKKPTKDGPHGGHGKAFELEHIIKEWSSTGVVWEYFKPKSPFDGKVLKVQIADDGKLQFEFPDGTERVGKVTPAPQGVNVFIGDKPELVAYTLGEKRWLLKDEDGDGVYEKRKQVGPPKDETGVSRGGEDISGASAHGSHDY